MRNPAGLREFPPKEEDGGKRDWALAPPYVTAIFPHLMLQRKISPLPPLYALMDPQRQCT